MTSEQKMRGLLHYFTVGTVAPYCKKGWLLETENPSEPLCVWLRFWLIAKTNIPGNYKKEKLSVYLNQPCYWVVTQLPARCLGILAPSLCNPARLKGDNRKYLNVDLILWLMGKSNKYSESAEQLWLCVERKYFALRIPRPQPEVPSNNLSSSMWCSDYDISTTYYIVTRQQNWTINANTLTKQ